MLPTKPGLAREKFAGHDPLDEGTPKKWMDWLDERNDRLGKLPGVDIKFDKEPVFFFSVETVRELLAGETENLVLGYGCRPKLEKYTRLRPFLYSVKSVRDEDEDEDERTTDEEPIKQFRPHFKFDRAFEPGDNGKIKPNKKIKYAKFMNRQVSFLRRNMILESKDIKREFKASNEFNGFAHTKAEWLDLLDRNPSHKVVVVVFGVDKDKTDRTRPMVATVLGKSEAKNVVTDIRNDKFALYNNGGQCCPNET